MVVKCHGTRLDISLWIDLSKKELLKELYILLKKFFYMTGFKEMGTDKLSCVGGDII